MKIKILLLILNSIIILGACKKENSDDLPVIPNELVGNWLAQFERDWPVQDEKLNWNFSKTDEQTGEYEYYREREYPIQGNMIISSAERGSFSIEDGRIIFGAEMAGSQIDVVTYELHNSIWWFTKHDSQFSKFTLNPPAEFSISENTLIVKMDYNNDGDHDDPYENMTYTRE